MKDWLAEITDQIALGEHLAESRLSCGQRFGFIAVDNAVEYMLICYVEVSRRLVGGQIPGGISKSDWEKKKQAFPELLLFVVQKEPRLSAKQSDILRYHDFRNGLYHVGKPVTTSPEMVLKYSKLAREVLEILFAIQILPEQWQDTRSRVAQSLAGSPTATGLRAQVSFELILDTVKFSSSVAPTAVDCVALCIHGYFSLTGAEPSRTSLLQSLSRSGFPLSSAAVRARISDLRSNSCLQKSRLALSAKGRKDLARRYIL